MVSLMKEAFKDTLKSFAEQLQHSHQQAPSLSQDLISKGIISFISVVKFRRTGESARSEEDNLSGEHEIQIGPVHTDLEAVELEDGTIVPKEFANPTDDTFMVEDAVEAIGFGKFQWKLSILTGLAWASNNK
ncbi:hypothetical protein AB205_0030220 [Aquarana catesbeiana]|uniref:Uncharacterized protein n=1 Tax=Aquarana catesbeiana TaxID=8400 RepID=A0A2G9RUB7_AQUCT|nr:hypothetical protein AB205_0030220 [Aquarana catesbeiana]